MGTKIIHHFFPHTHDDGRQHHAHTLSLAGLFIYLQILIVFAGSLYLIKIKAPQILGTASFTAQQIIALTNAKRASNGLPALSENTLLDQAAAAKGNNMLGENYWAHNSPSGKTPWSFISAMGYRYIYAGENLGRDFSDASSLVDAWMNSPSHRSNLLDPNFKEIGVYVTYGSLTGREGTLVVQHFGNAVSQIPPTQPVAQASPSPAPVAASPKQEAKLQKASPSPAISHSPSPQVAVAQINPSPNPADQTVVLASRKFSLAKFGSLALVGFVFALFLLEVTITLRRRELTLRPGVLAHLMILGFVLFVLWYAVGGAIL